MHHYRSRLDRLEVDDVRWSTYDDHREIPPFQFSVTYSGWLMCGKERVYCHLPERVKRQFGFIHDIPRHPSDVLEMPKELLATVLIDPVAWFYPDWRQRCERSWCNALFIYLIILVELRVFYMTYMIYVDL